MGRNLEYNVNDVSESELYHIIIGKIEKDKMCESKKELKEYANLLYRKLLLSSKIDQLTRDINSIKAMSFESELTSGGIRQTLSGKIAQLVDYQTNYSSLISEVEFKCMVIQKKLQKVTESSPLAANILSLRYIEGVKFEDIPDKINVSYRNMMRYYEKGLKIYSKF